MPDKPHTQAAGPALSRRELLIAGAAAGLGAAATAGATSLARPDAAPARPALYTFEGIHQAGIARAPAAHATYLAFDLGSDTDRDGLTRLMRLWSDDARRLMAGTPPLADTEPELAAVPAGLTITFGWGPAAARLAVGESRTPAWLAPLPAFSIDALEDRWSGGDLLALVAADDALTVAHAVRMLTKDAARFATVRWRQDGFRHAPTSHPQGTTMRNLLGQLDGTANPAPGSPDFDAAVWIDSGWLAGGTSLVLRRIAMDLDTWDEVDRVGRENAVGRTLDTGAPLTGTREHDKPDLDAMNANGLPVISDVAHVRRAHVANPADSIVRLGYNYDDPPEGDSTSNSGLLFGSLQADVSRQFVPIQQRLAEADLLNVWTTPVGSAVFAVPPGCGAGGFVGDSVLP